VARFIDFDACKSEALQEPVSFQFGGETFVLPPELPLIVGLRLEEIIAKYKADETVPQSEWTELGKALLGVEWLRFLATGVSVERLGEVIGRVIALYRGEPGNRKARRKAGRKAGR
jgi:hypothetical protein